MRTEQFGPELPRFVTHMRHLVDDATAWAAESNLIVRKSSSPGRNGYRRIIQVLPAPEWHGANCYQYLSVDFEL